MEDILQELLTALILAVVSLLAYGCRTLIAIGVEYLRARLGAEQYRSLQVLASTVVRTLAQQPVFENLVPAEKKELAVTAMVEYAAAHNLPVDEVLIDKLIEEAVQIMKTELGPSLELLEGAELQ